jgi:hypothetical protein
MADSSTGKVPDKIPQFVIDCSDVQESASQFIHKLSGEVASMLAYASEEGKELDDSTRADVAALQGSQVTFDQWAKAHSALAKLVAPATPISIEATKPEPNSGFIGSLKKPRLIWITIWFAVVAAVGFVLFTSLVRGNKMSQGSADVFIWTFAAALGGCFYVLFKTHDYVKDRTFDPRYNSVYVVRLVLGILSGLILSIVVSQAQLFKEALKDLGPAVIALLGGFSVEAVYQILQRLVEILLAAVRGDGTNAAKTQAAQDVQKVKQNVQQQLVTLATDSPDKEIQTKLLAAAKKAGV